MSVQHVETVDNAVGNGSIELTSPVDDVLFLMPEEENNNQKIRNNSDSRCEPTSEAQKIADIKEETEKKQVLVNQDLKSESDDDDDDDGHKITINPISDKYSNSASYANQFQISIHAGHEDDLDLNVDSFNDSANAQTNNHNQSDLNLNGSKNSNQNESNLVPGNETNNLSSSNGSINESNEQLKVDASIVDEETSSNKIASYGTKLGIDESICNDMKYLFKNTRYFLIKSYNYENVDLAKSKVIIKMIQTKYI